MTEEQNEALKNARSTVDWDRAAASGIYQATDDAIYEKGDGEIYYSNGSQQLFNVGLYENKYLRSQATIEEGFWALDIAQSHHFTVQIRNATSQTTKSGKLLSVKVPSTPFGAFLPVKNMTISYSGYDSVSLPFSAFSDFPLLRRRRIEVVNLTCYDDDNNTIEKGLVRWGNECFPGSKYVAYMDEVVKELIYQGFAVDGVSRMTVRRFVIPVGQVQVSRDYESNDAKLISFSVACVGDGSTCASGSTTAYNIPDIEDTDDDEETGILPLTTIFPANGGDSKEVQVMKGTINLAAHKFYNAVTGGIYGRL